MAKALLNLLGVYSQDFLAVELSDELGDIVPLQRITLGGLKFLLVRAL